MQMRKLRVLHKFLREVLVSSSLGTIIIHHSLSHIGSFDAILVVEDLVERVGIKFNKRI